MKYITIDGDDIGQKITASYLSNDLEGLTAINVLVSEKTRLIAEFLRSQEFVVLFCAADGVAGYTANDGLDNQYLFNEIERIANEEISFSIGVGDSLREAYVALLSAKSSGKARLHSYREIQ